jgi:hypothetical protein
MNTGHFSTPTDFPHVQLFFFFQISFSVYQDTSSQMVDQMNQAIDVVIPWMDEVDGIEDEDDEKIIDISGYKTNVRPLYLIKRKKDIAFIRQQFKAKHRLLLRTFNTYAYYACEITEMQQKVLQHMTSTGAYSLIMELNETNQQDIEKHLNNRDKRITFTLNNLLHDQSITLSQWKKMKDNPSGRRFDSPKPLDKISVTSKHMHRRGSYTHSSVLPHANHRVCS